MLLEELFDVIFGVGGADYIENNVELIALLPLTLIHVGLVDGCAWRQGKARLAGEERHAGERIWEVVFHHTQQLGEDATN